MHTRCRNSSCFFFSLDIAKNYPTEKTEPTKRAHNIQQRKKAKEMVDLCSPKLIIRQRESAPPSHTRAPAAAVAAPRNVIHWLLKRSSSNRSRTFRTACSCICCTLATSMNGCMVIVKQQKLFLAIYANQKRYCRSICVLTIQRTKRSRRVDKSFISENVHICTWFLIKWPATLEQSGEWEGDRVWG